MRWRLYLGSYGHGISLATASPDTGLPGAIRTVADTPDPSYLAASADGRFLYAANERESGTVSAFAVEPDGSLRTLGSRSTHGAQPCHVHLHPSGRFLLAANYGSGSVAVHPVTASGALDEVSDVVTHSGAGPDRERQDGPHAHQVVTDPSGRYVLAVDLGADAVFTYRLEDGVLRRSGHTRLRPGSGPRHLAFHPSGRAAYLTNELDGTVAACAYDPESGRLTVTGTAPAAPTVPSTAERNHPSEVVVSPDGGVVYVANRGHESVATFAVAGDRLEPRGRVPCGGGWPRHMALSPDGRYLYVVNQQSGDLVTFRVDPGDGALAPAGPDMRTGTPAMVLPVKLG